MKWLWITALLFLVTGVKSGPTRNDGDPEAMVITEIDKKDQELFTFTLLNDKPQDITHSILVVRNASGEYDFKSSETETSKSLTFEVDLTQFSGSMVDFLILAKNAKYEDVGYNKTEKIPFPDFPNVKNAVTLKDPRNLDDKLFRVEGTLGNMHLGTDEPLVRGDINYSFLKGPTVEYVPCQKTVVDGVDVCDTAIKHTDPTCTTEVPIVDSAVLAHGPKDSATIKLTFQNNAVTHEAILIPQPSQSSQSPDENVLCTDFTGSTCNIKWSDPSSAVLQLIIIQKTTGQGADPDTWATSTFDIHDRELAVTQLGADIIEGRWLMLEGEYSVDEDKKSTYRLRKTVLDTDPLVKEDIEVDCSHLTLDPKLCFGYFPGLKSDETYTLTVAYKEADTANKKDQIESLPVKITASKPELEILSRHTTTHQNQQRADVQICFQHLTPTEGRSFSHYEMLIINEKGQWLKHSLMQEEEEGGDASRERLCFAPFTINTTDFALTEATRVVVSQRAVDGITVLASGESVLF